MVKTKNEPNESWPTMQKHCAESVHGRSAARGSTRPAPRRISSLCCRVVNCFSRAGAEETQLCRAPIDAWRAVFSLVRVGTGALPAHAELIRFAMFKRAVRFPPPLFSRATSAARSRSARGRGRYSAGANGHAGLRPVLLGLPRGSRSDATISCEIDESQRESRLLGLQNG